MNENKMKPIIPLTIVAMTALIAGCGQPPQQVSPASFLPQSRHGAQRAPHHGSWMSPDAKSVDLLYVSNSNAEVTVYQYWRHNLVGVLTSFNQPKGICADNNQNIYVADYSGQEIDEYAHGGTKPIAKFERFPRFTVLVLCRPHEWKSCRRKLRQYDVGKHRDLERRHAHDL